MAKSKADYFAYSTLTESNTYVNYGKGGGDLPVATEGVTIVGGANKADKKLVTALGVKTPLSAADVEYLKANTVFQLHEKNGFIVLMTEDLDPEVVVTDGMQARSPDAPLVEQDFPEGEGPKVVTGDGTAQKTVEQPKGKA